MSNGRSAVAAVARAPQPPPPAASSTATTATVGARPSAATLLKYDAPVPLSDSGPRRPRLLQLKTTKISGVPSSGAAPSASTGARSSSDRAAADQRRLPPLEDILSSMFPPVVTQPSTAGEVETVQSVSLQPATRLDAIQLQEALDDALIRRQARETGICAVRSELYEQAFNELIRQVTLQNPEQGLLLLRIRDEAYSTVEALRALYVSAVEFGNRKALTADHGIPELKRTADRLQQEKIALEVQVLALQAKCEEIDTQAQAARLLREKVHGDELNFYRKTNHQLATQLKTENDKTHARK